MNESRPPENPAQTSREEIVSALFANMVIQQTNMALMFLGQMPHPETGERIQDVEAARMFIDQLEMLEIKTKGNLDKREEGLLKQSLTALRMAFVDVVEHQPAQAEPAGKKESPAPDLAKSSPDTDSQGKPPVETGSSAEGSESRKKFSKKY
jgi:hypothetical protein